MTPRQLLAGRLLMAGCMALVGFAVRDNLVLLLLSTLVVIGILAFTGYELTGDRFERFHGTSTGSAGRRRVMLAALMVAGIAVGIVLSVAIWG